MTCKMHRLSIFIIIIKTIIIRVKLSRTWYACNTLWGVAAVVHVVHTVKSRQSKHGGGIKRLLTTIYTP